MTCMIQFRETRMIGKKQVPKSVAEIINKNWNIVEKFASSEDNTMRVLGMKFPREGYT
jgi:hypothetical protein